MIKTLFSFALFFSGVYFGFAYSQELKPLFTVLGFAEYYADNLSLSGQLSNLIELAKVMLEKK